MSSCLIITGGDFSPFTVPEGAFVIACDRGYAYARRCGVRPHLVVGDFDSYSGELDPEIPLQKLPTEKDDTDTMSALRYALSRGFAEITLVCALGGRLDHTLANLQAAVFAAKAGPSPSSRRRTAAGASACKGQNTSCRTPSSQATFPWASATSGPPPRQISP